MPIRETALETIQIELAAIAALQESINSDFEAVVNLIWQSQGRLVVTGIGKSAIVAQKIVATMNSTGTPALYMHAADAIHGDLGMIRSYDVVICISKSGDTPEIKALVPLLKSMGNSLIGMVSNRQSYLGQNADFVLHTPIQREADPNNLAPTSSTTAQMVMGDALATALIKVKDFTPNDFAKYHPGGALGKQLYLKVADIYKNHESPKVSINSTLQEAILEMTAKRLGATAVVGGKGELLGIVTDGDLRRVMQRNEQGVSLTKILVKDIMSTHPKIIAADILAVAALALMREHSIMQLVVVANDQTTYLGIIHLHDLLKEGLV